MKYYPKTFSARKPSKLGIQWDHVAEICIRRVSSLLSPPEQPREAVHSSPKHWGQGGAQHESVFLPNEVAAGSLLEYPAGGKLCGLPLRSSERPNVLVLSGGRIVPRESIPNDFNGIGSQTVL